jgi:ubiquinone/menaquinone biosynthesis C-methylase UbiE
VARRERERERERVIYRFDPKQGHKKIKPQNKQEELLLFDVEVSGGYDTDNEFFYHTIADRLKKHAAVFSTGSHCVLEAGCGTGAVGRRLINAFSGNSILNITGVDLAPAMIAWNKKHPQKYFSSIVGDLENTKLFKQSSFDLAICPMVLHHFPNPEKVINNIAFWLKPNGYLYIIEPNGSSPADCFSKFIRRILEKIMGLDYTRRFATVNETDHSMKQYMLWCKENKMQLIFKETLSLSEYSYKNLIGFFKGIMYKLTSFLPQPISGDTIIILARKNRKT